MQLLTTEIPVKSFQVAYAPMPTNYPVMPLCDHRFQPVAYTQGTIDQNYVSVLLPLPVELVVNDFTFIEEVEDGEGNSYYQCTVELIKSSATGDGHQLAMIGFSIDFPEGASAYWQWVIAIKDNSGLGYPDDASGLGQVVMDANILPTRP